MTHRGEVVAGCRGRGACRLDEGLEVRVQVQPADLGLALALLCRVTCEGQRYEPVRGVLVGIIGEEVIDQGAHLADGLAGIP